MGVIFGFWELVSYEVHCGLKSLVQGFRGFGFRLLANSGSLHDALENSWSGKSLKGQS